MKKTIEVLSDKLTIPFCILFFIYIMYHLGRALIEAGV